MSRSTRLDVLLAALLLPLWGTAFALHVQRIASGDLAWPWVYVRAGESGGPPRVTWVRPGTRAAESGLEPGDAVLRVGRASVEGAGPAVFFAAALEEARGRGRVAVRYRRGSVERETGLVLTPAAFPWRTAPITLGFVLAGAMVLLRRAGTPLARSFFVAAVVYALHWTFFFGGPRGVTYAWIAVFAAASTLFFPLLLRPVLLFFREGGEAAPRRLPRWPWLFAIFGPVSLGWSLGTPLPPEASFRAAFVLNLAWVAALFAVLARGYRRADPRQRRRVRWVLFGLFAGLAPVLLADVAIAAEPRLARLHDVAVIAEAFIPISLWIAITRDRMFDVDRVITSATAYSIASVAAIAALLFGAPRFAAATSGLLGLSPAAAQALISLAVAAAVLPAQRSLRPRVERIFFAERHALQRGFERLLAELGDARDASALLELLGRRLEALLRPRGWAVYGALGEDFDLLLAGGETRERLPARIAGRALAGLGAERVIDLEARAGLREELAASPSGNRDGPAGAALLLPIPRGPVLWGLVCLGEKSSGDMYTTTDRALLAAVADKASAALLRFDETELLRQERAMRSSLERYVPSTVASRIARGDALEGGERIVSVLFVDVRGYSSYSERIGADAVFRSISRLTDAVSDVIRRGGGTVVEFLGDGVMALFGAPEPLPEHARAAVDAACEIVAAVEELGLARGGGTKASLAVGVGVATGPAFVGNIETGDRLIYTAIGDTVNLASRLQGLTRTLDAAVAIDATTREQAGSATARFENRGALPVRGRRAPVEVWTVPLARSAAG